MEKKNTILLTVIAVATLLVAVVGATFAYFTATNTAAGDSDTATVTTETVSAINVTSQASKEAYLEYPGGVSVLAAGVNVSKTAASAGSTSTISYDVNLKYTNNTGTALKYTIYTTTAEAALALEGFDIDANCNLQVSQEEGQERYAYVCSKATADAFASLGTKGTTGSLEANTAEAKTVQVADETITVNSEDATNDSRYYFVVVEYPSTGNQTATDSNKEISLSIEVTEPTISTTADSQ